MKTLYDLGPNECRYAVGRDQEAHQHLFCAKRCDAKNNYCLEHHKLCNPVYVPRRVYNTRGKRHEHT